MKHDVLVTHCAENNHVWVGLAIGSSQCYICHLEQLCREAAVIIEQHLCRCGVPPEIELLLEQLHNIEKGE